VGNREIELLTQDIGRMGVDFVDLEVSDEETEARMYSEPQTYHSGPSREVGPKAPKPKLPLKSSSLSSRTQTRPLPPPAAGQPSLRALSTKTKTQLPLFSYRNFRPNPPKIAYTSSISEADDLLSCLKGPILGFDMEWPISGFHKHTDLVTGAVTKKIIGGKMGADGAIVWEQCKTALVQVCDESLVVLVHVWEMNSESKVPWGSCHQNFLPSWWRFCKIRVCSSVVWQLEVRIADP
jgi:hypothetical protein